MNPALLSPVPQPDPLPLPAPLALLHGLLLLTFFLHLVPMNLVLGGSIIAVFARWRGRTEHARELVRRAGKWMPVLVAATVTFGVAPLLFVQTLYGRLFFVSAVLMGWFWFAVIPLVLLGYYGTYLLAFRGDRLGSRATVVSILVALAFVSVSFLYSNNMSLYLRPDLFVEKYLADAPGLQLNLGDPTLLPRWLHFLTGAIAVAGMAVSLLGMGTRRLRPEFGEWAMRHGAHWFTAATTVGVGAGAWWLVTLPRPVMLRFMGLGGIATATFAVGIVAGLAALLLGAMAIRPPASAKLVGSAAAALLVTLVAMVFMRDQVRTGMLHASFEPTTWVEPQWGVIALFALLLIAALATVAWMAVALAKGRSAAL
jgi:hypothetical protein